jgi:hypothetical protein
MTSLARRAEVRRVQRETGRIYSICYSDHFATRCTVKAGELVAAGAIGCVTDHKVLAMPQSGDAERRAFARDSGADDQSDTVVFGIPAHISDASRPRVPVRRKAWYSPRCGRARADPGMRYRAAHRNGVKSIRGRGGRR